MLVSKSVDGGLSWRPPVTLVRDDNPRFLNDKNTITADPADACYVYAVWDRLQVQHRHDGRARQRPDHDRVPG
jgi:hypothetical protein